MSTADDIILDLITANRQATSGEAAVIIAHVGQAPFATYLSRVPNRIRVGLAQYGIVCPVRASNVEWHLLERIHLDQQWPPGTTTAEYVRDLQRAVAHPESELWTYRYFGRPYAGFFGPSHIQGLPGSEPYLFVAYSPTFSTLTTGYQTSGRYNVFDVNWEVLIQHR